MLGPEHCEAQGEQDRVLVMTPSPQRGAEHALSYQGFQLLATAGPHAWVCWELPGHELQEHERVRDCVPMHTGSEQGDHADQPLQGTPAWQEPPYSVTVPCEQWTPALVVYSEEGQLRVRTSVPVPQFVLHDHVEYAHPQLGCEPHCE